MAHRKPASKYVLEIERLHFQIVDTKEGPSKIKLEEKLHRKLGTWETKLTKVIYVANNEHTPWSLEEVGLVTKPMETKKESGHKQVGDYVCCLIIEDGRENKPDNYHRYLPLVVERKTCEDFNGTIIPKGGWSRFKREIATFRKDSRFDNMVIIVESNITDSINYKPEIIYNKQGKKEYNKNPPVPADVKIAKIAKCFVLGAPVLFADTTHQAMNMYKNLIRQTIIEQYDVLLGL